MSPHWSKRKASDDCPPGSTWYTCGLGSIPAGCYTINPCSAEDYLQPKYLARAQPSVSSVTTTTPTPVSQSSSASPSATAAASASNTRRIIIIASSAGGGAVVVLLIVIFVLFGLHARKSRRQHTASLVRRMSDLSDNGTRSTRERKHMYPWNANSSQVPLVYTERQKSQPAPYQHYSAESFHVQDASGNRRNTWKTSHQADLSRETSRQTTSTCPSSGRPASSSSSPESCSPPTHHLHPRSTAPPSEPSPAAQTTMMPLEPAPSLGAWNTHRRNPS